jgi:hypothetical protein
VLVLLAIALYVIAVLVSSDRRRTTVYVGLGLLFAAIAVLAVRRVGGDVIVDTLAQAPDSKHAVAASWSIGTSLLVEAVWGTALAGALLILGAWLLGPGRRATDIRRRLAPSLRDQPALSRVVHGALLLALVWWHPAPWTGRLIPLLILALAAFAWLEFVRRRALEETAATQPS